MQQLLRAAVSQQGMSVSIGGTAVNHLLSVSLPLLLLLPELELDESLPELDDDPELTSLLLLPPDEEEVGGDLSSTHTSAQARMLVHLPSRLLQCTALQDWCLQHAARSRKATGHVTSRAVMAIRMKLLMPFLQQVQRLYQSYA